MRDINAIIDGSLEDSKKLAAWNGFVEPNVKDGMADFLLLCLFCHKRAKQICARKILEASFPSVIGEGIASYADKDPVSFLFKDDNLGSNIPQGFSHDEPWLS